MKVYYTIKFNLSKKKVCENRRTSREQGAGSREQGAGSREKIWAWRDRIECKTEGKKTKKKYPRFLFLGIKASLEESSKLFI